MVLPGLREPHLPPPDPAILAAARAAELADGGSDFEKLMIQFANISVVLLLFVVLLFTLLTAGPDKKVAKPAKGGETSAEKRRFSAAEVAKHCTAEDVWVIIKGKVYDVTSYVEEHPGGDAILRNAGRDSTKGFMGPQHPTRVYDIIEDFCIGTCDELEESKKDA